ncbi:Uu.00g130390.m01.CDS01 [Anthostomella pinea]|uniref:Uu.00g130390.m01.CDS01 n=1 Tax=Anthostomella pinea TaxID=933095 RepID=A0AAI8VIP3_9PEZI|nr:Uu.00g130390.m01.CDS01 [Anthostomella pinea]
MELDSPTSVGHAHPSSLRWHRANHANALAISAHDGELTYRELDRLSTQLAYRLVEHGVQNTIVPVHIEKSMWAPVAQLGVMKAGAASVVLDRTQPAERLRSIVHQLDPRLILTSVANEPATRGLSRQPVIVVGWAALAQLSTSEDTPELPLVASSARLYVVFTSGSTGLPKGAMITHSNFASAIEHQQHALKFRPGQRVFDFASYAFDVAWSNFLHTITVGGCLCIPSEEERKQDIPSALRKYKVNYAHFTPSVAWFSSEHLPESVKVLHFSGEELKSSLVQELRERAIIINTYGPAECSVTSTMQEVESSTEENPPIGHGLGTCTWVVSLDGARLMPVGAVGELWIEGPLVGHGYLNDQKKTAAVFIENPPWLLHRGYTSVEPGRKGRLYRTGDLVRYNRHDGSLSFVGRKDTQVKIRGQRVELSEIEHHLRGSLSLEDQRRTHVIAEVILPQGSIHPVLVALVSPRDGIPSFNVVELVRKAAIAWEQALTEVVPAYMIPSAYIPIERFITTATGKTDRRSLREAASAAFWKYAGLSQGKERMLPATESEQILLQVWSDVLNISDDKISTDTAFTRLGGDSITAMQVVSRCRAQNINITVGDVLRLRTIKALASQSRAVVRTIAAVSHEEDAEGLAWPLSPMQQLFFDAHPNGLNHYTQSFLLRVTRPTIMEALRTALAAVVQRHSMLRVRFRRREDSLAWEQKVVASDHSAFTLDEHPYHSGGNLQRIVQARQTSLDIQKGPVFAADLFNGQDEDQSLLLSAHHIIIDLVSWRVIWHDISRFLEEADSPRLPPAPLSYQTWCRLQRNEGHTLEPGKVLPHTVEAAQLDFWGLEAGDNRFADSDIYESTLDAESTALLLGRSNESMRTETLDVLVGALVHSFREAFADRPVPAVFLEGHGREPLINADVELAETVGWFTTLCPMQVPCAANESLVEAVCHAKDTRAAVPGKGRPYIACRYHSAAGREVFAGHRNVELLLNYRGVFQQLENADALLRREDRRQRAVDIREFGADYQRMALIEINIVIEDGRARVSTTTHLRMRHRDRLEHWLLRLLPAALRAAPRDLLEAPPRLTLADFSLLSITYAGLDSLLTEQLKTYGVGAGNVQDIYPCTPLQEGILLSRKKGTASYHNSWVWRCSSAPSSTNQRSTSMSAARLVAAWEAVARRHSVFATIFATHPDTGRDIQIVLRDPEPSCTRVSTTAPQSATEYLLEMDVALGTSACGPECAITVCDVGDDDGDVACRLDMSHALIDASSIPVLLRDLAEIYATQSAESVPEPPLFREVVSHIQHSESMSRHLTYWQAHLAGARRCELLGDLSITNAPRTDGRRSYGLVTLPQATTARVASFCREQDITRAVFLQLTWALVLSQFTGMEEVCFGYVCSGRDTPINNIESIVGPLISMLVARINLGITRTEDVLQAISEQTIEHLGHQHTSLAEVQHAIGVSGPLFNTAITVREVYQYGCEHGLRLEEVREEDPHEYDLLLSALLEDDKTDISVQYRGDYMSTGFAENIAGCLGSAMTYLIGTLSRTLDRAGSPAPYTNGHIPSLYHAYFRNTHGGEEDSELVHWRSQFEHFDGTMFPPLPLGSHQPRADASVECVICNISWPQSSTAVSLVKAAWASVQAAHDSSNDVCFGLLCCDSEPTSQQLATSLPTRVTLNREVKVSDLLDRLDTNKSGHPGHRSLNFLRVRLLSEEAARACQFQTLVAIILPATEGTEEGGLQVVGKQQIEGVEKLLLPTRPLALTIRCFVGLSDIRLRADFDCKAVENDLVTRMLQQFECALRWLSAPAHSQRMVRDVETVSEQDLRRIWGWNCAVPEPATTLVHDLFTRAVRAQPEAPAISAWDGELTYRMLDDLSTQLALYLVQHEVGHNTIIPIYIEKSLWMPVAQLAVMKAGGASVLLDSTQPVERARAIVNQVRPKLVISSPSNKESASLLDTDELLLLDWTLLDRIQNDVRGQSAPRTSVPSDLLYVVFTSGSTGSPKGAMITHANFASAVRYQQGALGYSPGLRVYDFVSYAFDVTWSNMLHSLTSGACLCIPSDEERKNDMIGSLQASQATFIDLTPSILRLLKPRQLPQLRQILLSGESFTKSTLGDWANHPGLLNTYGPAECSVKATMAPFNLSSSDNDIGCGEGLITWVVSLDNPDRLAPLGVVGELWLEGPLVGMGYLGDQAKTTATFVNDPRWLLCGGPDWPGRRGRLYRTGDLVRYECRGGDSGRLIFIGRRDSQIKIRGQRVELGEIESHVRDSLAAEHGHQVQVLVDMIRPRDGTNDMLVAFVCVARKDGAAGLEMTVGLDYRLKDSLPAYMIPTACIPVDHMPVGATGKTDRRRLRAMGAALTLDQLTELQPSGRKCRNGRAPSPTEALLLEMWATVLGMDAARLSPDDNFLRVGGESLNAMRLVAAARERGLSLSVADIFKWPVLVDLAHELDKRSPMVAPPHQQIVVQPFSLLDERMKTEEVRAQAASLCGVDEAHIADVFPCTPLQEGLLALTMRRPGDYVLRQARLLGRNVNPERFRRAWEQVVAATPILRTRITHLPGMGLAQVVIEQDGVAWRSESDVASMMRELEHDTVASGTPLVHFAFVESHHNDEHQAYFVWSIHHALFDGWSLALVEEALRKAYQGDPIPDSTPMQTFVRYIRQQPDEDVESFWRGQLQGSEAQPIFTSPSPSYQPRSDQMLQLELDDLEWTGDYTASTVVRAAWAILLSAYTNSAEAVFGVTVSGRQAPVPGIELIVGPTIATVPLRIVIDRNTSIEDLLRRVQAQGIDMTPFEQAGLPRIQQLDPDCEQASKFQTLLVVQPESRAGDHSQYLLFQRPDAGGDEYDDFATFNTYPLMLECQLRARGMHLRISVDSHVVDQISAQRMGQQLATILRQLCAEGRRGEPVSSVHTASAQDLQDICRWNPPLESIETCVHDLFGQVARRQPSVPAVCAWDGEFSYQELDDLSTQLARSLSAETSGGGVAGTIVPLFFEKSKWMPVAQLGVMKAGAASVALDATLPLARLGSIVQQTEQRIILSSAGNKHDAMHLAQPVMVVDEGLAVLHSTAEADLPSVNPSSTAYVVFTSGSTGTPKGAIISHSNFASAVRYQQHSLELNSASRVYDFVSYAFDVSWSNVLQTLCAGGCLCIPSEHQRRQDPAQAIVQMHVNYAHLTPTVARLLQGSYLPDLKTVSFIGEPLSAADAAYWEGKARVINTYGPAECTPVATVQPVEPHSDGEPPIGRGVGAQTWIVDTSGTEHRLAAIGAVGELWLGGPLVGQGYLNNVDKTAQAFIDDPPWLLRGSASGFPGWQGRFYRTGDLGRYNSDGTLSFMGRKDAQIKIRGQRLELGEVEHHTRLAFASLPGISQVVAEMVTPIGTSDPMLVAFLCLTEDESSPTVPAEMLLDATEMANIRLTQALPSYMIPAAYVPVGSIPMTASGKTDRIALRKKGASMKRQDMNIGRQHMQRRAPETPAQAKIHDLVARLLDVQPESLGIDDNFIRAGGDSIKAMQLVSMARSEALSLTVSQVLTTPNLEGLAAQCISTAVSPRSIPHLVMPFAALGLGEEGSTFVKREILPRVQCQAAKPSNVWPVTTTQKAYIEDALRVPRRSWYQFYIDFLPTVDEERLAQSCTQLLNRHDIFRSVFVSVHGRFYQAVFEDLPFSVERHDVSTEDIQEIFKVDREQEIRTAAVLGTHFLRVKVLRKAGVGVRLVLSMSHTMYDGISLGHIARDLSALYRGEALPPPPSFAGYIDHVAAGDTMAREYWRALLDGTTAPTAAFDLPLETVCDGPPAVLERIVRAPRVTTEITPATIFTAACAIALARASGLSEHDSDVVFGRVVSTRSTLSTSLQDVIGPCINTVPVRVAAAAANSSDSRAYVLAAVQRQYIDGLPHEAVSANLQGFDFALSSATSGCTTQFQNIGDRPTLRGMPTAAGSVLDAHPDLDLPVNPAFLWLYGTPLQDRQSFSLEVMSGSAFSKGRALHIMDELCAAFSGETA